MILYLKPEFSNENNRSLSSNQLAGTIPTELEHLNNLQKL